MQEQKYIHFDKLEASTDVIVIFPPLLTHSNVDYNMRGTGKGPLSAGFTSCGVSGDEVVGSCYGKSTSLKLIAEEADTQLLVRQHYDPFMPQKYVRFASLCGEPDVIILIPNSVMHLTLVRAFAKSKESVVSAGFVAYSTDEKGHLVVECYGQSTSLEKEAMHDDTYLLQRQHHSQHFELY